MIKKICQKIKNRIVRMKNAAIVKANKEKLVTERFSIISQQCIGGVFYHDMGKEFLSPTINLFIPAADFMRFTGALREYMSLVPKMRWNGTYPVGMLGDVEIHFLHYSSQEEALEAWERRKKRIDYENLIVLCTDRDGFDEQAFEAWCSIPYKKVLFTANSGFAEHKDSIYYPEFVHEGCVQNELIERRMFYRDGELIKRINSIKEDCEA